MKTIRIGTRRSMLAMAQSRIVADALLTCRPGLSTELVPIVTRGDRTAGSLAAVGGKGLFTAELEKALRIGEIDLAVHSAKDVPFEMDEDLAIAAVLAREDARDALVSGDGVSVAQLPAGATVATSSPRRRTQLLDVRSDLRILEIRGNVETRVQRVLRPDPGQPAVDAVVLAMAGLRRSGLLERHGRHICPMEIDEMLPAAGQGTLLVQASRAATDILQLAAGLTDPPSLEGLLAERNVLAALEADCHSCLAVHIAPQGSVWRGRALAARRNGDQIVRVSVTAGSAAEASAALMAGFLSKRVDADYLRN